MKSGEMSDVKRVVLAYSGGLNSSVILRWLQYEYKSEVVTFAVDLGQGEELEPGGAVSVVACDSKHSLFDQNIATFDDDNDGGACKQADAGGFIKLNALPMRIAANAKAKRGG